MGKEKSRRFSLGSALRAVTTKPFQPLQDCAHGHPCIHCGNKIGVGVQCFLSDSGVECLLGAATGAVGAATGNGDSQTNQMLFSISKVLSGSCLFQGLDDVKLFRIHVLEPIALGTYRQAKLKDFHGEQ